MSVTYFGDKIVSRELFNEQLVYSPPSIVSVDVETISLKERLPLGFSIATSPSESWYFRTYPALDREIELVLPLLNNPNIKKVFHNSMFDLRAFPLICDIDTSNIADTNVMARLLGKIDTKLLELAPEVNRIAQDAADLIAEYGGKTMLDVPEEAVAAKCANDTQVTLALYYEYLPRIDSNYFAVEMEVVPILINMSLKGLKFNEDDRARLEANLEKDVEYYRNICKEEDFNPASNQQVGYMLAKRGSFLPLTRSRRQLKVDEDQLEFLDDPIAAAVLAFRRANKLLTTYIRPLARQDRIYTEYNLDAVVGRVSSSNMNMQNIPGIKSPTRINARHIFAPDSGVFTTGDYAQEHLYIIMYKSGDRQMQRVYLEGEYEWDIHKFTARELGIPRYLAKTINYAIAYGATPRTISAHAKIRDIQRCSRYLDKWLDTFRDAAEWIRGVQKEGLRTGWAEPTLFGRRIKIPEELNRWGKPDVEGMKRKAVNYPILGSDGEIMKRALIRCKQLPLAITVHDSITCDGDINFPVEDLENIAPVRIPFEVKQTLRWE